NAVVDDDVPLERRTQLQEPFVLLLAAEAHHMFHAGAVVPAPVKDDDFARGRKMREIALDIHLRLLPVSRRGQSHDAEHTRADALRDTTDQTALAGGVATLEDDHDPRPLLLDPVLQYAELDLQLFQLLLVLLAAKLVLSFLSCVL